MHATNSTAHSHTDSCNPHTPTTTHPDSHIDSPSSYGLHTLPWDSVTCIYSYSTHTITQLALRPAQDELIDRDALEALYEQGKEEVALAESEGLPSSARAFRVEQRAETVGQGATGSSSSGYSLSFQRQSSVVSASKWVWSRADEEVRWSASKWRVDFARL
ncbi:hypothetical protein RTBOTA2_002549 [Rhodotorula toruloides]|nr:hypothetical protein RTBOTA2_002549 [Rhodotorula toruloides]